MNGIAFQLNYSLIIIDNEYKCRLEDTPLAQHILCSSSRAIKILEMVVFIEVFKVTVELSIVKLY